MWRNTSSCNGCYVINNTDILEQEENPNVQKILWSMKVWSIALGEGKSQYPYIADECYERLSHPHLFPTSKFGYEIKREIPLSPI